jgi:gamma-glutamyltranspeptidase/glutathione hydrolase
MSGARQHPDGRASAGWSFAMRLTVRGALLGTVLAAVPLAASAQGLSLREAVVKRQEMVVTANPLASQAGARILARGGNAVDAFIAAEAVLGLVEPQSSGLGGGGFVVYYDAASGTVTTYDAREHAPRAAGPTLFLDSAGRPLSFSTAVQSGRSVGVPGVPRLFEVLADEHGSKRLRDLLQPARDLALQGFAISPRLASLIAGAAPALALDPAAAAYFLNPDGTPKTVGTALRNRAYASTLLQIGTFGSRAFYEGAIARDIVATVRGDDRPGGGGDMTLEDLRDYRVIERAPVCGPYRTYRVCGMGPPSSGGIATLQILGMIERFPMAALGPEDPLAIHYFLQANRLAFADRNLYVADSDFVTVPVAGLLDPTYLAGRSALIGAGPVAPGLAAPGTPPAAATGAARRSADASPPRPTGTTHLSIVDRFGNALAATVTIESGFGNYRMVRGFLLNNELTDFSFDPGPAEAPIANRVEGGKRPRSSMSPTIALGADGRPAFVAGSPGGASIIGTTTKALVAMIDWGFDPQEAANQAHFQNNNGSTTVLESLFPTGIAAGQPGGPPAGATGLLGPFDVRSLAAQLQALGWTISATPTVLTSGLGLIEVEERQLVGGADPRREGLVTGR